ncbi:uncharacterized protein LOC126370787 [Pectinophora gossypiella]|uniref:uncharacterized protein LOC126370787 n=1 Tax=Pectinophora gossypiella TaxID=13191 RepID=UPI00214E330A|nr:uncharacterized protein LOC126370787 [Pectinophora gossypiella]
MSKRKSPSNIEDEFSRLFKKMKKLEKKIRVHNDTTNPEPGPPRPDPGEGTSSRPPDTYFTPPRDTSEHDVLELFEDESPAGAEKNTPPDEQGSGVISFAEQNYDHNILDLEPSDQPARITPLRADQISNADVNEPSQSIVLDDDVLEILGEDPTATLKYGPDIRTELASRFQHIATEGLPREDRKKLIEKYPLPANCLHVGAPTINPEIKAALTDNIIKRDKGIESKQKEMASAITCLTDIISIHLNSKDKDNQVLQKLMDIGRILCDIQHGDSITRRNFILFAVKNDMQEHLKSTKIDTSLFGQNLSDTLKSAKAVNKSGADLKIPEANKNIPKKAKPTQPLNRRAAATSRRPAGAAPTTRGRAAAAAPRAPFPGQPQPAPAFRTSSTQPQAAAQPQQQPRRRY